MFTLLNFLVFTPLNFVFTLLNSMFTSLKVCVYFSEFFVFSFLNFCGVYFPECLCLHFEVVPVSIGSDAQYW